MGQSGKLVGGSILWFRQSQCEINSLHAMQLTIVYAKAIGLVKHIRQRIFILFQVNWFLFCESMQEVKEGLYFHNVNLLKTEFQTIVENSLSCLSSNVRRLLLMGMD